MAASRITLNTAIIGNAFNIITGAQTGAGITVATGGIHKGISPNVDRATLFNKGPGTLCWGDGSIPNDGSGPNAMPPGDSYTWQAPPVISLLNKFFSVTANSTVLQWSWE